MRAIVCVATLLTLVCSMQAQSAPRVGNGGDGVILSDKSVRLLDLYERSLDPEVEVAKARKNPELANSKKSWGLLNGLLNRGQRITPTGEVVGLVLDTLSIHHPLVARAIDEELNALSISFAPANLQPNPDTESFVDLTQVTHIGCARNINNDVLIAHDCSPERMGSAGFAALLLHESVYNLYKKANPQAPNSYAVRSFVSALFLTLGGSKSYWDRDVSLSLQNLKLGTLLEEEHAFTSGIWKMGGGPYHAVKCQFNDGNIEALRFSLYNAVNTKGLVKLGRNTGGREVRFGDPVEKNQWKDLGWEIYKNDDGTWALEFSATGTYIQADGGREVLGDLAVEVQLDQSLQPIKATAQFDENDYPDVGDHWSAQGTCSK